MYLKGVCKGLKGNSRTQKIKKKSEDLNCIATYFSNVMSFVTSRTPNKISKKFARIPFLQSFSYVTLKLLSNHYEQKYLFLVIKLKQNIFRILSKTIK